MPLASVLVEIDARTRFTDHLVHATAALVVGKLCSSKRQQNALTSAIKEYAAPHRLRHPGTSPTKRTGGASPGS